MGMAMTITMAMQASQALRAYFLFPAEPADRMPFKPDASSCAALSASVSPAFPAAANAPQQRKRVRTFPIISMTLVVQHERANMTWEAGSRRCGASAMAAAESAASGAASRNSMAYENEAWFIQNCGDKANLGRELEFLRSRLVALERSVLESQWASLAVERAWTGGHASTVGEPEQVNEVGVLTREEGFSSRVDVETVSSGRPSARKRRLKARRETGLTFERSSLVCNKEPPGPQNVEEGEKRERSRAVKSNRGFQAFFLRNDKKKQLTEAEQMVLWETMRSVKHLIVGKARLQQQLGFEPSEKMWASYLSITPQELIATLREGKTAQNKLVNANLRLVVSIARRYQNLGMDLADLIQEGTIGLVKGVERFDSTRGFQFSTYAHWWILQGITRALARMSRAIKLPYHLHETVCRIKKIQSLEAGTEPVSLENLSKSLKIPLHRVKLALRESNHKFKSMDEPLPNSDNLKRTLHQLVADSQKDNQPWHAIEKAYGQEIFERYLRTHLLQREHEIIQLRYGLSQQYVYPLTRENIGQFYGLSRERVRQLEKVALSKLRSSKWELDLALFRTQ